MDLTLGQLLAETSIAVILRNEQSFSAAVLISELLAYRTDRGWKRKAAKNAKEAKRAKFFALFAPFAFFAAHAV
jgi:hypothetical protein